MRKGHVNQILLITDGCSNHGKIRLRLPHWQRNKGLQSMSLALWKKTDTIMKQ